MPLSVQTGERFNFLSPVFFFQRTGIALWKINIAHQIHSFCCSVRTSHMSEHLYRSSRLRHWKSNSMTAMTGRGDNDTSVKSKVERDKTVATKDGGCGRSSRWWNSNEVKCMTVWCVPGWGILRINTNQKAKFWNFALKEKNLLWHLIHTRQRIKKISIWLLKTVDRIASV